MHLIDLLQRKYPSAKRTTLRRMLGEGRVRIGGDIARVARMEVPETAELRVDERSVAPPAPSLSPLELIHEDIDVLVVKKPPGLLTSTVASERRPTAIAIIREYLKEGQPGARAGVIHRLDRDASGLLIFSKNNYAYESLKRQFFKHTVERIYTAIIHGCLSPQAGKLESRLVELPDGSVRSTRVEGKGQRAVTRYQTIHYDRKRKMSVVKVTLETGRKHQIRAHLAERGNPIVGDSVYGPQKRPNSSLMLAATSLSLTHPRTGERLTFEIQPPPAMREAVPSEGAGRS